MQRPPGLSSNNRSATYLVLWLDASKTLLFGDFGPVVLKKRFGAKNIFDSPPLPQPIQWICGSLGGTLPIRVSGFFLLLRAR